MLSKGKTVMDSTSESLLANVHPELASKVRGMAAALKGKGITIRVTSAKRSTAQQAALYARRGALTYPVARPGTSKHELGLAVDLALVGARNSSAWAAIGEEGERQGLRWGGRFSKPDPVHFELAEPRGEVVLDGNAVISQAKSQAATVRVFTFVGVGLLVLKRLSRD